jgi:hypothetical protein
MIFGAVAGAVGGLLGAKSQSKAAKKAAAAAKFNPFSTFGPSGNVSIQGQNIHQNLSPEQQQLFNLLGSRAGGLLGGGPEQQMAQQLRMMGLGGAPGAFMDAQNTPFLQAGALPGFSGLAAHFGQQGADLFGAGTQAAFGAPTAGGEAAGLFGMGHQALGQDFGALEADRLAQMRAAAQPFEERAGNQRIQSLFSSGRLGTTGGARAMGEFDLAQQQADIQRQMAASDFAQGQLGQNRQFAQGLFGMGLQGIGMDQSRAMQLGQLGLGAGGFGFGAAGAGFDAIRGVDAAQQSRADQRLARTQGLFGFGTAADQFGFDQSLAALGAQQSITDQLRAQAALGLEGGAAGAAAGARAGQFMMQGASNPLGAGLLGLGTAMVGNAAPGSIQQGFSNAFGGVKDFFGGLFNRGS